MGDIRKHNISKSKTDQFSFVLRPSKFGIGVFTTHKIKKGTLLKLWNKKEKTHLKTHIGKSYKEDFLDRYCVKTTEKENNKFIYNCPEYFNRMSIGWYLNHSHRPNTFQKKGNVENHYARHNLKQGEEITIDYRDLGPGNMPWLKTLNKSSHI